MTDDQPKPLTVWQLTKLQWAMQRDAALARWVMHMRPAS